MGTSLSHVQQPSDDETYGYAVVADPSPLDNNGDAFTSGSVHEIRLRFFNLIGHDDAGSDFRCALLKIGGGEQEGPFDLPFMTGGSAPPFHDPKSLNQLLTAVEGGSDAIHVWAAGDPSK
jgi:hypothetical protein